MVNASCCNNTFCTFIHAYDIPKCAVVLLRTCVLFYMGLRILLQYTITSGRGFDILSCLFVQFVHLLKIYTFYQALLGGSRPYIIMQCLAPQQWKVFTIHVCTCICSSSAMSSPFFLGSGFPNSYIIFSNLLMLPW